MVDTNWLVIVIIIIIIIIIIIKIIMMMIMIIIIIMIMIIITIIMLIIIIIMSELSVRLFYFITDWGFCSSSLKKVAISYNVPLQAFLI